MPVGPARNLRGGSACTKDLSCWISVTCNGVADGGIDSAAFDRLKQSSPVQREKPIDRSTLVVESCQRETLSIVQRVGILFRRLCDRGIHSRRLGGEVELLGHPADQRIWLLSILAKKPAPLARPVHIQMQVVRGVGLASYADRRGLEAARA